MLALVASALAMSGTAIWQGRSYVDDRVTAHATLPSPHAGGASAELVAETRRDVSALRETVARIDRTVSGIAATLASQGRVSEVRRLR